MIKLNLKACVLQAFFCFVVFLLLIGCNTIESRLDHSHELLAHAGFQTQIIKTTQFPLFSAYKGMSQNSEKITIFIEGDGYAWVDRYTVSDNPTPINPVGLNLAIQSAGARVYLARPCQYIITKSMCQPSIWSYDRFSPAVIDSYMQAFDPIAHQFNGHKFDVVGFSGGGYIALVLAAKRQDIEKVTTVAGLLDPKEWTDLHHISPLRVTGSSDSLLKNSKTTTFNHICRRDDEVVPCSLAESFVERARNKGLLNHRIIYQQNGNHDDHWRIE